MPYVRYYVLFCGIELAQNTDDDIHPPSIKFDVRFQFFSNGGLAICLLVALSVACLKNSLTRSFWLDECLTAWIVNDGFYNSWSRSLTRQVFSPLYFVVIELWGSLFGFNELTLRIPSLIATVGTGLVVFRVGFFLRGIACGTLAVILLLSSPFLPQLLYARPYGIVVFLSTVLLEFLITANIGKLHRVLIFIGACVFIPLLHPLYSLVLIAFGLVYAFDQTRWSVESRKVVVAGLLCGTISSAVAFFHALVQSGQAPRLSFALEPGIAALGEWLFPLGISTPVALALMLVNGFKGTNSRELKNSSAAFNALIIWSFLAPLTFFCLAKVSAINLFVPRYAGWAFPGFLLFISLTLTRESRSYMQSGAQFLVAACAIFINFNLHPSEENWRAAARLLKQSKVTDQMPVLVTSGLVEGRDTVWLKNRDNQNYYLSPAIVYQMPGNLVPAPPTIDTPNGRDFLGEQMSILLKSSEPKLYYVFNQQSPGGSRLLQSYTVRLKDYGFELSQVSEEGLVRVAVFTNNHLKN